MEALLAFITTNAIVTGIIGSLVAAAIGAFFVWLWRRLRRRHTSDVTQRVKGGAAVQAGHNITGPTMVAPQAASTYQAQNMYVYQSPPSLRPVAAARDAVILPLVTIDGKEHDMRSILASFGKDAVGETAGAYRGLARYFFEFAQSHSQPTSDDFKAIEDNLNDILAAMDWCNKERCQQGETGQMAAMMLINFVDALTQFFAIRGYWEHAIEYGRLARQAALDLEQLS